MDKIVKTAVFCLLLCKLSLTQEWQSIPKENFGLASGFFFKKEGFKINPYDNSLWFTFSFKIYSLSNEGVFRHLQAPNIPVFNFQSPFWGFAFTQEAVFALKSTYGLMSFRDEAWEWIYDDYDGNHISYDKDTVWICGSEENFISYYDDSAHVGSYPYFMRTIHKNGNFWGSNGNDGGLYKFQNNTAMQYHHSASLLMDSYNYDFKFSKKTDSMYVAGKLGLSIAHEDTFIDSVATGSSTNMPSSSIVEFEFDQHDNIWAIFGDYPISSTEYIPHSIGYYEQATRTWTKNYDATNSPIDFTNMFTIEVDTAGNLWVAQENYLHILKINNYPTWLNAIELEKNKFSLYPNPGSELLNITFKNAQNSNAEIIVIDVNGKELIQEKITNTSNLELNTKTLENGIYFIIFKENNEISSTQKWIKL